MGSKNKRMFKAMNEFEQLHFLGTATRVTVAKITRVENGHLVNYFVPKVRGLIIRKGDGELLFKSPDEARKIGRKILIRWKKELTELEKNQN